MSDSQINSHVEWIVQLLLIPKRLSFRWRNRNRTKVTESLIFVLKKRYDDANRANLPIYCEIYNVGLFIALLERDISSYNRSLFFAKSELERQFFARGLAVLLYEGAEDLPKLLGKQYRISLKALNLEDKVFQSLNEISSELNKFKKNHSDSLFKIRNYIGAHRDHDASKQLEIFSALKSIEIYRLGAEFSEPIENLVSFYTYLLNHMHNPFVMLQQVAKTIPHEN